MKELPLKALRVFESVARCGSFKDAADELCVSQSAVSHQIKHLETWLGQPLFDRSGHRPRLLTHGQMLSSTLQNAFHDIEVACQRARHQPSSRNLVIAAIPSVAICWLIPRLPDFQNRHSDIATRVVYALHGQSIDFRQVDLAFVFDENPPVLPGHTTQLFQPGTSVPVCSQTLYDSLDHAQLTSSMIAAGLLHDANTDGWKQWLGKSELKPIPEMTGPVFEDFNLLRAAALDGQGVALCPLALIGTDLVSGRLVQLSDIAINERFNYYLISSDAGNPSTISVRKHFSDWALGAHDTSRATMQTR